MRFGSTLHHRRYRRPSAGRWSGSSRSPPAGSPPLDRLAGLAKQAGDEAEAARLRGRKAELDGSSSATGTPLQARPGGRGRGAGRPRRVPGPPVRGPRLVELAVQRRPELRARQRAALDRLARAEAARRGAATLAEVLADLGPAPDPSRARTAAAASTGPAPDFTDDAEAVGLRFRYDAGASTERQLPETMGRASGLLDYDGDGWLDVYVVQGGPVPARPRPARQPATASSATAATARSRTSPSPPGSPAFARRATATAWPSATTTTTATPTCSSPAGGPTPSTATGATARSRTSPSRRPGRRPRLADLGGLRRPRRRRRPRPLRLPLPRLGRRASPSSAATRSRSQPVYCNPRLFASRPDHALPQRRRPVRRRHRRGRDRRPRRPRPGRRRRRPRRRRPDRPLRRQRQHGQLPVPQPGRTSVRGGRPRRRGGRQRRRAATRRGWASPAATSTATAGPTWPSPTSTASRRRSTRTSAGALRRPDRGRRPGSPPAATCLGFGIAFLDANNDGRLDLARPTATSTTSGPSSPTRCPLQLFLGGTDGRLTDVGDRAGPPFQVPSGSAAAWPSATSTTTAASTCSWSASNEPLAYFHNRTDRRPLR